MKKASTINDIPGMILKDFSDVCDNYILHFINDGIATSVFCDELKHADVIPIFKDTDRTMKSKYRPVSLLPIVSKLFERTMEVQTCGYMKDFLSPFLCGYRKGYSTQHALVSLIEKWKKILDKKGYGGAVLMDLSKAFDTLDHELLIAKLHAYEFSKKALKLIHSYLTNRFQCTKVNNSFSSWVKLLKGVPQGSILGPLLIYFSSLPKQIFVITRTIRPCTLFLWNLRLY